MIGICLGLQLLFSESNEFGFHKGLDIIKGKVVRFKKPPGPNGKLKIPQVGWNTIYHDHQGKVDSNKQFPALWKDTPLEGIPNDAYMYFVHSYYAIPEDDSVVLTKTSYGNIEFCSSLSVNNIYAFQFHPERSGKDGLKIYENLMSQIKEHKILE